MNRPERRRQSWHHASHPARLEAPTHYTGNHSLPRKFLSFGSVSTPSASRRLMSIPSLFSRSVSFKTQYLDVW